LSCLEAVEQLWTTRGQKIAAGERALARRAFDRAIDVYRRIGSEAREGS
jgi:hypothetical protein